jgi:hypothetical protein
MVTDTKVAGKIYACSKCDHVLGQTDQPTNVYKQRFYIISKLVEVIVDEEFELLDFSAFTKVNEKFWELIREEAIPFTLKCKQCAAVIGLRIHAGSL